MNLAARMQQTNLVLKILPKSGADPGFFLGGGALVSCSTSTPINHTVFFFSTEYQLYWKTAGHLGGGGRTPCTLPLDPPLEVVLIWLFCPQIFQWQVTPS